MERKFTFAFSSKGASNRNVTFHYFQSFMLPAKDTSSSHSIQSAESDLPRLKAQLERKEKEINAKVLGEVFNSFYN